MDIISLGKAKKVRMKNEKIYRQMGVSPEGTESDVAARVGVIEALDPKVGLIKKIGSVSGHTAINLNKHNLRMQMHLALQQTRLKESIVDTFQDTTSLDESASSNWAYESGEFKVAEGKPQATLVFKEEVSDHPIHLVFVSKVGLASGERTISVSLDGRSGEGIAQIGQSLSLIQVDGEYPSSAIYWTSPLELEGVKKIRLAKATTALNGGKVSFLVKGEGEEPVILDGTNEYVLGGSIQIGVQLEALTEEVADRMTNGVYEGIVQDGIEYRMPQGESDLSMIVNLQSEVTFTEGEVMRSSLREYTLFGSYDERKVR